MRQSAKRNRTPEVLEPREIQDLLLQLESCFRLMVLLAVTTGLRRSELLALGRMSLAKGYPARTPLKSS